MSNQNALRFTEPMSNLIPVNEPARKEAFGSSSRKLTVVDRFGIWLSGHEIGRTVGNFNQLRIADIGCV